MGFGLDGFRDRNTNQVIGNSETLDIVRCGIPGADTYAELISEVETEMQERSDTQNSCTIEIDSLCEAAKSAASREYLPNEVTETAEYKVIGTLRHAAIEEYTEELAKTGERLLEAGLESGYDMQPSGREDGAYLL